MNYKHSIDSLTGAELSCLIFIVARTIVGVLLRATHVHAQHALQLLAQHIGALQRYQARGTIGDYKLCDVFDRHKLRARRPLDGVLVTQSDLHCSTRFKRFAVWQMRRIPLQSNIRRFSTYTSVFINVFFFRCLQKSCLKIKH